MKLIGAALGVHGNDAAGIPAMVRGQNAALDPKLADTVWRRDGAIYRVELGILQLVPVDRDARSVDLPARNGIGVAVVGDQVSRIPQGGNLVTERPLPLYLRSHPGQVQRVPVQLGQLGNHLVVEDRGRTGLIGLQQRR